MMVITYEPCILGWPVKAVRRSGLLVWQRGRGPSVFNSCDDC